jgi:hypothetical protein
MIKLCLYFITTMITGYVYAITKKIFRNGIPMRRVMYLLNTVYYYR